MANNCYFEIKVKGKKEGLDFIKDNIRDMGRIFECGVVDKPEGFEEDILHMYGDCAWSVQNAILDNKKLQKEIANRKLDCEIFSEESGFGFAEHYLWKDGVLWKEECEDFYEWSLDDIAEADEETKEEIFKKFEDFGVTRDNYLEEANDEGWIRLGGFNYDWEI